MAIGYSNILNTDSSYVAPYLFPSKQIWEEFSLKFLLGQEQKLYATLGANDLAGFMRKIHELLNEAGNIREILARFKTANLVQEFELPHQVGLKNTQIHIRFNTTKGINLDKLFLQLNGINGITIDSKIGTLDFIYNERAIKSLMNVLEDRLGTNRELRISENSSSSSMRTVNTAFKQWLEGNFSTIGTFTINGQPTPVDLNLNNSTKAKDLFGLTKPQIEEALKDPATKQMLETTRQKVYNSLYNLCSGSKELQDAFKQAWEEKIGFGNTDENLRKFAFLSKGNNLRAGVPGAIQELYAATLAGYLKLLDKKILPKGLIKIVGNVVQGGEQPKADLTILNQIGIQVKAYGMDNIVKKMESNLHPNALDAQLRPYGALNVGDAIVQSIFNTSTETKVDDFETRLRDYAAALLNLTTSNELDVNSTVCFYLVDAQFLVPGSEIIRAFKSTEQALGSTYDVSITSSFVGKSDEEYEEKNYLSSKPYNYKSRPTARLSPGYMQYFDKIGLDDIKPDDKNVQWYNKLYTNRISIRIRFDYGFMGNNKYDLLGY